MAWGEDNREHGVLPNQQPVQAGFKVCKVRRRKGFGGAEMCGKPGALSLNINSQKDLSPAVHGDAYGQRNMKETCPSQTPAFPIGSCWLQSISVLDKRLTFRLRWVWFSKVSQVNLMYSTGADTFSQVMKSHGYF